MTTTAPEGWYPDPEGVADERYFDGDAWTQRTRANPVVAPSPQPGTRTIERKPAPRSQVNHPLVKAAERVSSVANVFAWGMLFIGIVGSVGMGILALSAIGDNGNALESTWPAALLAGLVLLVNAVALWLGFRFIGLVAQYIATRSGS